MRARKAVSPVAIEAQRRREREDSAKRLKDEIRSLVSLRLEIEEQRGSSASLKHLKIVVVERAPALVDLPCTDPACRNGGYDLTYEVLRGLRAKETRFQAKGRCCGQIGSAACDAEIRIVAHAAYGS